MDIDITDYISTQSKLWPDYAENLGVLDKAHRVAKRFKMPRCGWDITVLLLHYRTFSITADTVKAARGERPCFLCAKNRPDVQISHPWHGYEVLVNPFPLHDLHFTFPTKDHTPQRLSRLRLNNMLQLATQLDGQAVFYNGPRCGASAPDHFHFQAVTRGAVDNLTKTPVVRVNELSSEASVISISDSGKSPYGFFTISSTAPEEGASAAERLLSRLPQSEKDDEPPVNLVALSMQSDGHPGATHLIVIPRRKHRPSCFGTGDGQMLVSPATLEMAGLFVTSRKVDAERLDAECVAAIYTETAYSSEELLELCNLKLQSEYSRPDK